MRKTIIAIAALGGAYLLYKIWLDQKKKSRVEPPVATSSIIEETIAKAKDPKCETNICRNRDVFKRMRKPFNSDESATVAPSINAKIGIF